jgi:hypothetical protein
VIDGMSGRLIPSSYSKEETAYLSAYDAAMEDRIITSEERRLLKTLARTYEITDERVAVLEQEYDSMLEVLEEE